MPREPGTYRNEATGETLVIPPVPMAEPPTSQPRKRGRPVGSKNKTRMTVRKPRPEPNLQSECEVEGCDREAAIAGLCRRDYQSIRYNTSKGPRHLMRYNKKLGHWAMRAGFLMQRIGKTPEFMKCVRRTVARWLVRD